MAGHGRTIIKNKHSEVGIWCYRREWSSTTDCCDENLENWDYCAHLSFDDSDDYFTLCLPHFLDLFGDHPNVKQFLTKYTTQKWLENQIKELNGKPTKTKVDLQKIFGDFVENGIP